jgi:hypothetical protein
MAVKKASKGLQNHRGHDGDLGLGLSLILTPDLHLVMVGDLDQVLVDAEDQSRPQGS